MMEWYDLIRVTSISADDVAHEHASESMASLYIHGEHDV